MGKRKVNLSLDELKQLIIDTGGIRPAARALHVDHTTVVSRLMSKGYTYRRVMAEYQDEIAPICQNPITVSGDSVITADWHIPFCSMLWLDRVLYIGHKEHIKQLIIAGDFFDFDRLSWWIQLVEAQEIAVGLEEELGLAEMVMEELERQFNSIILLGGNHWRRLLKRVTYSISTKRLLGLVGRKDDTRYLATELFDWVLLDDKIRVTHPARARKLDYTLARDLSILHPDQWLMVAHRHRVNSGFTPDGRPMWEIGWMGDTERMRYIQHIDSTYYQWVNGFAFYKDGIVHNLSEYNYNWTKK